MTSQKGSKASFDKEALLKIKDTEKKVPTQEVKGSVVTEQTQRTTLDIPKSLYLEFKRNYLLKYGITFKDFVVKEMTKAIENE